MFVRTRAILMLKAPLLGRVKTRLAAEVGDSRAMALYRWMGSKQLDEVPKGWEVEIRYAPDCAEASILEWLGTGCKGVAQGDGDLGERMWRAVQDAFKEGVDRVVLLGGDCPEVSSVKLREASEKMDIADCVVAPSLDGGYCFLMLAKAVGELFEGIDWGTSAVREQTTRVLERLGIAYSLTDVMTDVDDLDSLRKARKSFDPELLKRLGL